MNKFVRIYKRGPMSMVLLNLTLLEQGTLVELRNESDGLAPKPFHASCGFFGRVYVIVVYLASYDSCFFFNEHVCL